MTFHLNRFSSESADSQWSRYLQTQSHVSDIGQVVTHNRKELESTIRTASAEQQRALGRICGTLDEGFREVNRHLSDINSNIDGLRGEINAMAAMLEWKLSLMIEEQRLTNTLLGQVARLLRVPDSQKQRVYHIEQGLKYLKNAIREGIESAFYSDALESFKAAEAIERRDFITLNRIGQIHLYSTRHRNFALAEEYFLKSAREAMAEDVAGGTLTATELAPTGSGPQATVRERLAALRSKELQAPTGGGPQATPSQPFRVAAAEAYLYAGRAAYLESRLPAAVTHAAQARSLMPQFGEAAFEQAKYLAATESLGDCVEVLRALIPQERLFALKVLSDRDLNTKGPVLELLGELQTAATARAEAELRACRSAIIKGSTAHGLLEEAERRLLGGGLLGAMGALDVLTTPRELAYREYKKDGDKVLVRTVSPWLTLAAFVRKEAESAAAWERLKPDLARHGKRDDISNGSCLGLLAGFVLALFGSCHPSRLEWDKMEFLLIVVAIYFCGLFAGWIRSESPDKVVAATPFEGSDADWAKLPSVK